MSAEPLITLCDVGMVYERRHVLEHVDLCVDAGDFIAITGPNGGGKTTLLRILLGLLHPTHGTVRRNAAGLRIGYLPQKNMVDSHFPITVGEVVMSGLLAQKGLKSAQRRQRCDAAIAKVGLTDRIGQPIGELSGGQLQRALLARAIVSGPQLLVLDEPLSYIDKAFEAQLYDLIADLARTTTIVLVSHEMSTLGSMANRHFIVDGTLHQCAAHHHYVRTECHE